MSTTDEGRTPTSDERCPVGQTKSSCLSGRPKFGHKRASFVAESGANMFCSAQSWRMSGQLWPNSGNLLVLFRSILVDVGPMSADSGQILARFCQARARVVEVGRCRPSIGPRPDATSGVDFGGAGRECPGVGNFLTRHRQSSAGVGPRLAEFEPTSANFGRCPPGLRPIRANLACTPRLRTAGVPERSLSNVA